MSEESTRQTGLAFSGGGVRSAALCSGVLRRLLQKGVSVDYLSSVSGGGYTAASYMDWKFRNEQKDDPAWHREFFERLRQHSSPLCDCYNPCVGILHGIGNALIILLLTLGITVLRAFSLLIPTVYIIDYLFGATLRDQFTCRQENANMTVEGISKQELLKLCIPTFGPNVLEIFNLLFGMFTAFVLSYYLSSLFWRRTPKYLFLLVAQGLGYTLVMIFLPYFIEMQSSFTPRWAPYFVLSVVLLVWVAFPSLRDKASIALMVLVYALFIKWRVFKTPLLELDYSHDLFWKMIWAAGVLLWVHPYLGMIQMYYWYLAAARTHERTFFSPESRAVACAIPCSTCCQSSEESINKPLRLADLVDVKPSYKCNVTVNNWRKSDAEHEDDCEVLTFSPTSIERIDRDEDDEEFAAKGFIRPKDIKLSDAMMTSAAVLSYDLGNLEDKSKSFREIRVLLGLGFGNILLAQPGLTKSWMSWVVTLILQLLFGAVIIGVPLGLYFGTLKDWVFWERLGLISYVSCFLFMSVLAVLPTGMSNNKLFERFVRWCVINILHVTLLRILFGVTNIGPVPPPIMSLSDGGHSENLGLLPLLKLRLPRIVVVNGAALEPGDTYATEILKMIKQAREKLRCSFTGISGRDIHEDIRREFVEIPVGRKPRSYRFKVQYYEMSDFEERLVGEGEVLLLMPRHPDEGISEFKDYKWSDLDGDGRLDLDKSAWGSGPTLKASEVDRLSGCCFECCHWKPFNYILNPLMGRFPFHSTFNQMFTASQFSAYHREGYRACLEGEAAEFLGRDQKVVIDQPQASVNSTIIDVEETTSF